MHETSTNIKITIHESELFEFARKLRDQLKSKKAEIDMTDDAQLRLDIVTTSAQFDESELHIRAVIESDDEHVIFDEMI